MALTSKPIGDIGICSSFALNFSAASVVKAILHLLLNVFSLLSFFHAIFLFVATGLFLVNGAFAIVTAWFSSFVVVGTVFG